VITLTELCINVVGLELSYREAGPLYDRIAAGPYFLIQALVIAVAAVAFVRVASRFEGGARCGSPPV
jgi:dipeptide/tripeptide permease